MADDVTQQQKDQARLILKMLLAATIVMPLVLIWEFTTYTTLDPQIIYLLAVAIGVMEIVSYIILKRNFEKKGLLANKEKPYEKL